MYKRVGPSPAKSQRLIPCRINRKATFGPWRSHLFRQGSLMTAWIRSFSRRPANRRRLSLPPGSGTLRIAQITLPNALFENARYFPPVRGSGLEKFRPHILIGSASHLSTLAQARAAGQLCIDSLSFAVYSIMGCRDTPLQLETRKIVWHAFGVPVRELVLDGDEMPIAIECEAHEGWHVEPGITFFEGDGRLWFRHKRDRKRSTGLTGRLVEDLCPCGRPGVRILEPKIDLYDPLRLAV